MYKIVRNYFNSKSRVINSGLTLAEAQKHCHDPETSSSTCTTAEGNHRTDHFGKWFDSYVKE